MNANKQDAGGEVTNPDNVGGLLPCPGCGKSDLDHCPADFVAVNGLTRGMIVRCAWCHFAAPEAAWNRRELCRAAPAGGDVECFVREMRTSKGSEFFVVVKRDGRELTPHMYTERWKAEYDVASWQHLLCGAPKPDILAYGPSEDSAPAGSGEVGAWMHEDDPSRVVSAVQKESNLRDGGASASSMRPYSIPLLRKLQQGADKPLTADMAKALPGGTIDDTTFDQIEHALDRAGAPACDESGKWLTLSQRIAAIASQGQEGGANG